MGDLEAPCTEDAATWPALYLALGSEVVEARPTFTGDVFSEVVVEEGAAARSVVVLQHPCALRKDGVNLVPRVLVAEVRQHRALLAEEWKSFSRWMPLPGLDAAQEDPAKQHAAALTGLHVVPPQALTLRTACLSELGINTLLQRWTHHNSRVVVETAKFGEVTGGPFAEAELVEEWCSERAQAGVSLATAATECHDWLREADGGATRQAQLESPQTRSAIRRAARRRLAELNAAANL